MSKTKNTAKKQSKYLGLSFVIDVYKYLSYILLAAGVLGFFIVFFIQTIQLFQIETIGIVLGDWVCLDQIHQIRLWSQLCTKPNL